MKRCLGILTNDVGKRRSYLMLIMEAKQEGWETLVFTPHDVNFNKKIVTGLKWTGTKWERVLSPFPHLIHDVGYYHRGGFVRSLQLLRNEVPFLSSGTGNKWTIHQRLYKCPSLKRYLLPTELFRSPGQVLRYLKQHPVIMLKPLNGKGGKGIWKIIKKGELYEIIGPQENMKMDEGKVFSFLREKHAQEVYLLQKWVDTRINDGSPSDIRILVQKGEGGEWGLTGMAARIGQKTGVISNIQGDGKPIPVERYLEERYGADKVESIMKSLLNLSEHLPVELEKAYKQRFWEFGFDVGTDPDGHPWIFEVNIKPGVIIWRKLGEPQIIAKGIKNVLAYADYLYHRIYATNPPL